MSSSTASVDDVKSSVSEKHSSVVKPKSKLAARTKLEICGSPQCAEQERAQCVGWLQEVVESLPSIVVRAKGPDGIDTLEVRVLHGDAVIAERLTVRGIPLDPGEYTLRFEHEGASHVEKTVLLREGEKNALIEIDLLDRLAEVSVPTLVIHARGDLLVPFEAGGRLLADGIPGAQLLVLETDAHGIPPNDEAYPEMMAAIDAFLAEDPALAEAR